MATPVRCGILTISDRCYRRENIDESGPCLVNLLRNNQFFPVIIDATAVIPDDVHSIQHTLTNWADNLRIGLIITTGGTGFGVRDFTPEATSMVLERTAHGMMSALFQQSYPHSIMSRGVCGTRKSSLIINFPGSPKACRECFEVIEPRVSHIIDLIKNDLQTVAKHHNEQPSLSHGLNCDISPTVAFRNRESPYPAITVANAQEIIFKEAGFIGEEIIHFYDALGCVLVEDIKARDSLPPFRASMKDGYAVISSDGAGERKVLGASHAGAVPQGKLSPGFCVRITTGAPVPDEADAIVQVEDTELVEHDPSTGEEISIRILKVPHPNQDIRPVGSDIREGDVVLVESSKLDPGSLGILATCGVVQVKVYKKPIVGILSTGDELVVPETNPLPIGSIRDSNKTVLLNTFRQHKFTALDFGISPDQAERLIFAIRNAVRGCDVLVLTGGVSMGEKDLVKNVITKVFDGTIHFGRVFMKPGLPTTFATITVDGVKKLIFGLPGNPVSAAVTCNIFVLPALRKISGYPNYRSTILKVELTSDIKLDPRPEFHRAVIDWNSGKSWPIVVSTGNQISSRLLSFSGADVLLCLQSRSQDQYCLTAGSIVNAILMWSP